MLTALKFEGINLGIAALTLLVVIPLMIWYDKRQLRPPRIRFSSLKNIKAAPRGFKTRIRTLPFWLRIACILFLLVAFAHPYQEKEATPEKKKNPTRSEQKEKKKEERKKIQVPTEGIAIQLLIDRSGSMGVQQGRRGIRFNYIRFENTLMTKLDAVKIVSKRFIEGDATTHRNDKSLFSGRGNDMVGLFTFARYPLIACPLTLRHELLLSYIGQMETVRLREEDGTYIGYALQRAILHVIDAKSRAKAEDPYNIKSTIIVLITDGEQTIRPEDENDRNKSLLPSEAAQLAADNEIKIYTIAINPSSIYDENGTVVARLPRFNVDELQKTADMTGGKFYYANDVSMLNDIYHEIDQLEKSKIANQKELEVKVEKSKEIKKRDTEKVELFQPFLWAGLFLFIFEILLNTLYFRRIP